MDIFIFDVENYKSISKDILNSFLKREFKNQERMFIHSLSYFLLDKILKENYQLEKREIIFENKKPKLKTNELYFSISHSGRYIALAISKFNCGIDIEEIKPRNYEKIAKRMNFKVNTLDNFYRDWTEFEAIYKLNSIKRTIYQTKIENHMLTAVSENENESYRVYI